MSLIDYKYVIRWVSGYMIGFIAQAIGPNKSEKLTRLIASAHNIRGKVRLKTKNKNKKRIEIKHKQKTKL